MLKNNVMVNNGMNIRYDFDADVLYLDNGGKVKQSIAIDNVIMDVSEGYSVVALEILNASEELSVEKELLKKVVRANLKTIKRRDCFGASYVIFHPKSKKVLDKARVAIPISY